MRLLIAAIPLFRTQGLRSTGINQLVTEANTTAQEVYRHFGSKGGLVAAAIDQWGDDWRGWLARELERHYGTQPRLLAIFDLLETWLRHDNYRGPLDIKVGVELAGQPDHPAWGTLIAQRAAVHGLLEGLAIEAGARDPVRLATVWVMLMDGALVSAMIDRNTEPVRLARELAEQFLAGELK